MKSPGHPAALGRKPDRAKRDWPSGAVLAVFAVGIIVTSWRLGLGNGGSVGPGLWPFLCGVLLFVCSVGIALGSVADPEDDDSEFRPWTFAAAVALMIAFAVLMTGIGVVTATALIAFLWLRFIAVEGWRLSLLLALGIGVAVYFVFIQALDIPLPLEVFLPR